MNKIKPFFMIMLALGVLASSNAFAGPSPEATEEVRVVAAKAKLEKETNTVVLYAKGLCCPTCAIGVRKLISKLDFVDRSRFNKGVYLDTKTQLVTVAISEQKEVALKPLTKAVWDAGYTPVRVYKLAKGELQTETLPSEEPKS